MPLNSVNTNVGAMVALQNLNAINQELLVVQNRISTGKAINSAKDNPAIWAIAQGQRAQSKALDAVQGSLQRGQSAVDVALSAGESISDALNQMKEAMVAAAEPGITPESKAALNNQYVSLRKQIDLMSRNADFGGINLISAGSAGAVHALANANATSTIDVDHIDLSTTGAAMAGLPADLTATIGTAEISAITTSINSVNASLGVLGTGGRALDTYLSFVGKLQDTIDAGVGRLVDADIAKESAKLQALQVRQQLTIYALQIANSTPSLLLQLFRRAA